MCFPLLNAARDSIPQISPQISVVGYPLESPSPHPLSVLIQKERATAGAGDGCIVRGPSASRPPSSDSEMHGLVWSRTQNQLYLGEDDFELLSLLSPPSRAVITGPCCPGAAEPDFGGAGDGIWGCVHARQSQLIPIKRAEPRGPILNIEAEHHHECPGQPCPHPAEEAVPSPT